MSEPDFIRVTTVRPSWLPDGHAFCPGKREVIRVRQWKDDPFVSQNILTCEHGEWFDLASAWTDHQQFAPILASAENLAILPERAGREGDTQELPTPNDAKYIQDIVIEDITARKQLGIRRYGTALQPNNGRDALQDLYEELLDACMYIKQAIVERDEARDQAAH